MSTYFIGIDNGSQSSKVVIYDENGGAVASGRQSLRPNDTPRPGIVEHPDDDLWESIGAASRRAMAEFKGDPAEIAGVGLCTIRFCRALLSADGSLHQPVMSWMDSRVSKPHVDDSRIAWVTTSSGYITARFTGEFCDTAANYAGIWPVDVDTWNWATDDAELEAFGAPRDKLFQLVMPGAELGRITPAASEYTGIPQGLPLFATANDKAVEALGCGLRSDTDVLLSLGTYIASMACGRRNIEGSSGFWTNYACEPGHYLYESNGIRRGMWTLTWVLDLLGEQVEAAARSKNLSREQFMNDWASQVPAGSDGLMVLLDWLAPVDSPYKKGAILGFDGRQGGPHIYRAVLEAIAMTMADKSRAMAEELDVGFRRLIVSGGGSNSDLMMQILADCYGMPAVRTRVNNAASLGSAICAAVGSGFYPDFDAAIRTMVGTRDEFVPDAHEQHVYSRLAPTYLSIAEHTDPLFRQTYEQFG
jgi:sugar (pentulose or hexulose) kinase